MEDKVIGFGKGIHREPSLGAVGELSECVNMYGDGGEMKLLPRPKEKYYVGQYEKARFIHKNGSAFQHMIVTYSQYYNKVKDETKEEVGDEVIVHPAEYDEGTGNFIGYRMLEGYGAAVKIDSYATDEVINSITGIGNVLVVCTSVKMYYYLWTEGAYVDYSMDSIGDLDVQFSLRGQYKIESYGSIDIVNLNKSAETENETKILVAHWEINNGVSTKENAKVTFMTQDQKLAKGKRYLVEISGGSKYMNYGIGGVNSGYTFEGLVFDDKNKKDDYDDKDISTYKGGWIHSAFAYPSNSSKVTALVNNMKASENSKFVATADFTEVFVVTSSAATRSIKIDIYEEVSPMGYDFSVNKTDSSNIDALTGGINKFIKENATDKNMFIYPFFVRAAVKLIDGTYIKPSAPVLMIPNSGCTPNAYIMQDMDKTKESEERSVLYSTIQCDLVYQLFGKDAIAKLKARSQVVESIVIAVSEPVYTYDAGASSARLNSSLYLEEANAYDGGLSVCKMINPDLPYVSVGVHPKRYIDLLMGFTPKYRVMLPETEKYKEKLLDASNFYVIKEYKIGDINENNLKATKVEMEEGTLAGLTCRERMSDNATSFKSYVPKCVYNYNSRLTIGNMRENYFAGYNPSTMAGPSMTLLKGTMTTGEMVCKVRIEKNNKAYTVTKRCTAHDSGKLIWFYYPDADAKDAYLYYKPKNAAGTITGNCVAAKIELTKHPHLNGAYWLGDIEDLYWGEDNAELSSTDEGSTYFGDSVVTQGCSIDVANKVISSKVNNPFVIDDASASLVGMGEVQKLVANTKALSQGQFGQHPVLAFCTDGIWALSVGSEGQMVAVQPISRDVCNNIDSITQTDNAIVFTTDAGLMALSGSDVKQMCKAMDNKEVFDLDRLEEFYGGNFVSEPTELFSEMLKTSKIVYDYVHKLLWIFPNMAKPTEETTGEGESAVTATKYDRKKVYVVSLESGEVYVYVDSGVENYDIGVSTTLNGPESIVVDYPYTYMQMYTYYKGDRRGGLSQEIHYLHSFEKDTSDDNLLKWAYLLTRPIAFDDAYGMKVLYDMKLEKQMTQPTSGGYGSMKVVVFVSNDRVNWGRLTSLKGRSYKWYRFAVICHMRDYDRLAGLVCRIDRRRGNKLR